MTMERWEKAKELFVLALDQPQTDRASFLAEACGDDTDLRANVERLLAHDDLSDDFLEPPTEPGTTQACFSAADLLRFFPRE
jgi:hypothetical protein